MQSHRTRIRLAVLVALSLPVLAHADVWVFEPSAALDQRFDDNYTIDPENPEKVSATRLVGTLGLSREAQSARYTGLIRIDGLVTQSDQDNGDLNSNQVLYFNSEFNTARSSYGIGLNFKRDTPSRDIAADLTDISSVAADTGGSVTQDDNVARTRLVINPNWQFNLTRRTTLEAGLDYSQVNHALPSADDVLLERYLINAPAGAAIPNPVTIDDTGFFTIDDELDDYKETALKLGVKTQLTPISTLSFSAGFSSYTAQTEVDPTIITVPFEDLLSDSEVPDIKRLPKRDAKSFTSTFRVGYDRAFTQTLSLGFQVGIYANSTDGSDLVRASDTAARPDAYQDALDNPITKSSGFLANVTAVKLTGITTYSFKFGVDVLPSDVGSQVESLEAIGDLTRELGPLLDFSFRIRAYEPDALNAVGDDEFARRFLSMEPKLIWRFSRAWTAASSVRYRRQKSQTASRSGESNALLFSIKYTPPSAIRDAEREK